jgi:hypothetical protein
MTTICCVSDLHGHLPELPPHDLLLVAGDICPLVCHTPLFQASWLREEFVPWLGGYRSEKVVVWGNHDLIGEQAPHLVPKSLWSLLLQDAERTVCGLRIWGSPWQLRFFDWAFNLDEEELAEKYLQIPIGIDVIVSHGPPYGFGDFTPSGERVGSPSLRERIQIVNPRLVVTGHIHGGRGLYEFGRTIVVNASYVDEGYRPAGRHIVVDLQ